MNQSLWQLNPALSIEFNQRNRQIQIGLMSPNCYEITEQSDQLMGIINFLLEKKAVEKDEILEEIKRLFDAEPEDVFQDLQTLKLIHPAVDLDSRYARHELYYVFSGAPANTQSLLARKSVLLIGVGGIGSTCAMLLAAAGIGELVLADKDCLELSNLTRTTLFELSDLGKPKVESALKRLALRNPDVKVKAFPNVLCEETFNAFEELVQVTDMMILSGDSGPEVHKLAYELSKKYSKPLLNAGYVEHCGVVGPLTVGYNPIRERELCENLSESMQVNQGYKAASFGPLNSLVSSIAVNEVIRYFAGQEVQTLNKRLVIDSCNYSQTWEPFS